MQTEVHFFRETDSPPLKSQNTWMIAAALASGICLDKQKSLADTVEVKANGDKQRVTTWICGPERAVFNPLPKTESIDATEFAKRFASTEWCAANADHPIAYMRHFAETYQKLRGHLKTHQPSALIRRNGKIAVIDAGCPQALKEEILARL